MRNAALMTVALVLLCSTPVLAGGGGGAKKNAIIQVFNRSTGGQIFAIVDFDPASVAGQALIANPSAANLKAVGGQFVNTNGVATFLVTPGGQHTVTVGFVADIQANGGVIDQGLIAQLGKPQGGAGSTVTYSVTGAAGAGNPPGISKQLIDATREVAFAGFGLGGLAVVCLAGFLLSRKQA